MVAELIRIFD
jgi:hypothetical protein